MRPVAEWAEESQKAVVSGETLDPGGQGQSRLSMSKPSLLGFYTVKKELGLRSQRENQAEYSVK